MPRIDADEMETFVTDLVGGLGAPRDVAGAVASSLVGADLHGHHSHGVRLLPAKYAGEVSTGEIDPAAAPRLIHKDNQSAIVDGRRSFGHVAARDAVDVAVEKATRVGIGTAGVRNVTHIGRIGEWAERTTEQGMAFVAFVCNPGSRWVAPPGSAERRLSTNPIAIGVPTLGALEFPLVLDMATSQVARGKISLRSAEDGSLPDEWAVSETGESVTDPDRFQSGEGALLPLGGITSGHKGFGLSVMAELLATNVSDWSISGQEDVPKGNVAVFFAIDLTRFTSRDSIRERISSFAAYLRSTTYSSAVPTGPSTEDSRGLLPGEAEYRAAQRQRADGIELPEQDLASLRTLAAEVSLRNSLPDPLE